MLKNILAIVAGTVLAFFTVFSTDAVFHMAMSSAPAMPAAGDAAGWAAYMDALPPGALAAVLGGWTLAAFSGAAVAARLAGRIAWPGWVVTGLFLLATVSNFAMIPHPLWMMVAALVVIPLAGWLGARLASARGRAAVG